MAEPLRPYTLKESVGIHFRNFKKALRDSTPGTFARKIYYTARLFSTLSADEAKTLQGVDPRTRHSLVNHIPQWLKVDENRWAQQEHPHVENVLHAFKKGDLPSVGGDTSDLLPLDKHHFLFTMMDIAGKGPPANEARGNFQSYLRGALDIFHRHYVHEGKLDPEFQPSVLDEWISSLAKDLEETHRLHFSDQKHEINIFGQGLLGYLKVHPEGKHVDFHYVPFSHLPLIVLRKQTDGSYRKEEVESDSSIFNFVDRELVPMAPVQKLRLNKGDKLIVYTDGVTEARNHKGEMFEDRFHKLVKEFSHLSPKDLAELIKTERRKFIQGRPNPTFGQRVSRVVSQLIGKPLPGEDDMRLRIFEVAPGVTESFQDRRKEERKTA